MRIWHPIPVDCNKTDTCSGWDRVPYQPDKVIKDWQTQCGEIVQLHVDHAWACLARSVHYYKKPNLKGEGVLACLILVRVLQIFKREETCVSATNDRQAVGVEPKWECNDLLCVCNRLVVVTVQWLYGFIVDQIGQLLLWPCIEVKVLVIGVDY